MGRAVPPHERRPRVGVRRARREPLRRPRHHLPGGLRPCAAVRRARVRLGLRAARRARRVGARATGRAEPPRAAHGVGVRRPRARARPGALGARIPRLPAGAVVGALHGALGVRRVDGDWPLRPRAGGAAARAHLEGAGARRGPPARAGGGPRLRGGAHGGRAPLALGRARSAREAAGGARRRRAHGAPRGGGPRRVRDPLARPVARADRARLRPAAARGRPRDAPAHLRPRPAPARPRRHARHRRRGLGRGRPGAARHHVGGRPWARRRGDPPPAHGGLRAVPDPGLAGVLPALRPARRRARDRGAPARAPRACRGEARAGRAVRRVSRVARLHLPAAPAASPRCAPTRSPGSTPR